MANCETDVADFLCANGDLLPGTEATIRCRFGYEKPMNAQTALTCEESGKWSHVAFKCQPICGKVARHSVPLQIGGKTTNVTEVPWHVGIYKDGEQSCGGTIIAERLVISAAHCFSTAIDGVHVVDYKRYQVAAGKFMRGLNATETQKTQIRGVWNVTFSLK